MQIHEIIRTRRTALGLTQEQLAGKLGVSAPAVNKWERGNSYPDITLLPVLARTLRVDLNTLLSFREDLTETEIAEFLNRLYEVSRTEGCGAAFSLAEEKLRQFPNSDALAYSAAGLLEGLLTLFPGTDETARPGREDFVAGLYEQAAQSADPKIREWATYTVASRCIARGDLDRAEALLDQISNTHRDKRELLSALRRKQGRTEEAWTLLERELFDRAHGIQTTLLSLIEMAQAEGDRQRAQGFCDAARRAGEALDLSDYAVLSAPFQLAAAEQDGPAALDLLDRLLHSLTVPWDLSASPLYRHLATKEAAGEAQSVLLEPLLDQVEADPDCAFLREMPEYGTMVEKYRRAADEEHEFRSVLVTVDEVLKDRRNRRIRPDEQLVVVQDEHGALLKALLERVVEGLLETQEGSVRADAEAREKGVAQAFKVHLRPAFKPREAGAFLPTEEFAQQRGLPDAAGPEHREEFELVRGEALFERGEFP